MEAKDYKLAKAAEIDLDFRQVVDDIRVESIKLLASAFVNNVNRCLSLPTMTISSLEGSFIIAVSVASVYYQLIDEEHRTKKPDENAIALIMEEIANDSRDWFRERLKEDRRFAKRYDTLMQSLMNQFCQDQAIAEGVDATLAAFLTSAWTAFETLSGDLWIAAVNARPGVAAKLSGHKNRINKAVGISSASRSITEDSDSDQKLVKLAVMGEITKNNYDLRDKMGKLLVESEQVAFTSLKKIREAYSMAFPHKARQTGKVDEALSDKSLDALSAVRNLIVHKASVADETYISDSAIAPLAPRLNDLERLALDGEICRRIVNPAVNASVRLIKAVDLWLTVN